MSWHARRVPRCVVDIGVAAEPVALPGLVVHKVRPDGQYGTWSMTRQEAQHCLEMCMLLARQCHDDGVSVVATGDMGIGNDHTQQCSGGPVYRSGCEQVTGYGTG